MNRKEEIEEMAVESAEEAFFSVVAKEIDEQLKRIKIEITTDMHLSLAERYYDLICRKENEAREQTAKEILQRLYECVNQGAKSDDNSFAYACNQIKTKIRAEAKEYGVEVEDE